MNLLTLSERHHRKLCRFRRNTWRAIALCGALRLADAAFGLGLVEPAQTLAAQDIHVCPTEQEFPF
jgi:hypothetical protein